jgi:GT2 family glycosyltransferase
MQHTLNSQLPGGISVVVPAHNAGRTIGICLSALVAHVPDGKREIIVVDNGSTDDTIAIARQHPVHIVSVPEGFVSRVRNVGAAAASHGLVAFIDSDCVIRPGWRNGVLAAFADPCVGVAGRRHEISDMPTWVEATWHSAHQRPIATGLADVPYVPAGNLAARLDVFQAIGGFDESLETGEDPDLCTRVASRGFRVVESADIGCVHLGEPKSLRDVFRRERWHGRGVRLRYADGRLAPVALATLAVATIVPLALAAVTLAIMFGSAWVAALGFSPLLVPALYAAHYTRRGQSLLMFARLLLIYTAYFAGRTVALPVALGRMSARRRRPGP